jgi:hypothetical protein
VKYIQKCVESLQCDKQLSKYQGEVYVHMCANHNGHGVSDHSNQYLRHTQTLAYLKSNSVWRIWVNKLIRTWSPFAENDDPFPRMRFFRIVMQDPLLNVNHGATDLSKKGIVVITHQVSTALTVDMHDDCRAVRIFISCYQLNDVAQVWQASVDIQEQPARWRCIQDFTLTQKELHCRGSMDMMLQECISVPLTRSIAGMQRITLAETRSAGLAQCPPLNKTQIGQEPSRVCITKQKPGGDNNTRIFWEGGW